MFIQKSKDRLRTDEIIQIKEELALCHPGYIMLGIILTMCYIVMVIILIASPFLRGLGTIEVSLTFILAQFGFPIIAAATITLLFRFFEFWLPLLAGIGSFITRKDNLILRILPAFIILILGIVNIISAITPGAFTN